LEKTLNNTINSAANSLSSSGLGKLASTASKYLTQENLDKAKGFMNTAKNVMGQAGKMLGNKRNNDSKG